jgi:hypothetical protein
METGNFALRKPLRVIAPQERKKKMYPKSVDRLIAVIVLPLSLCTLPLQIWDVAKGTAHIWTLVGLGLFPFILYWGLKYWLWILNKKEWRN